MVMNERSDDGGHLHMVQLGDHDGDTIYVFYPEDATAEELKTMWIRSPESGTISLTDHQ